MKIIYMRCGEETIIKDPRSYELVAEIRPEKTFLARTVFEPMTSAILMQRSTN